MSSAVGFATTAAVGRQRKRSRSVVCVISLQTVLLTFFFGAAVVSQLLQSAYSRPMGAYPDEPSHYLSAVMVRDYFVSGAPSMPVEYATRYYGHYPAIAVGYWPPLFYIAGGSWMAVFGQSRTSILLFGALICATLQYLMYRFLAREFGSPAALLVSGAIPFIPAVAVSISLVMTDIPLTLMCLAAILSFGWFLENQSLRRSILFGLMAGGALLTKASAAWLVLLPPMALLLSRQWRMFLRKELWISSAIVAALYVPWLAISHNHLTRGLLPDRGHSWLEGMKDYVSTLAQASGPQVLLMAVAAGILILIRPARPAWYAVAVQPLCVAALLSVAPVSLEVRYGLMALPALVLLACFLVRTILERTQTQSYMPLGVLPVVAFLLMAPRHSLPAVNPSVGQAAEFAAAQAGPGDVILVSAAGGDSEVLMVAEFARHEPHRPARKVARGNKVLASSDWNQTWYSVAATNSAEVFEILHQRSVDLIVVSMRPSGLKTQPHHAVLMRAIGNAPDRWRLVYGDGSSQYRVYRAAPEPQPLMSDLPGEPTPTRARTLDR